MNRTNKTLDNPRKSNALKISNKVKETYNALNRAVALAQKNNLNTTQEIYNNYSQVIADFQKDLKQYNCQKKKKLEVSKITLNTVDQEIYQEMQSIFPEMTLEEFNAYNKSITMKDLEEIELHPENSEEGINEWHIDEDIEKEMFEIFPEMTKKEFFELNQTTILNENALENIINKDISEEVLASEWLNEAIPVNISAEELREEVLYACMMEEENAINPFRDSKLVINTGDSNEEMTNSYSSFYLFYNLVSYASQSLKYVYFRNNHIADKPKEIELITER